MPIERAANDPTHQTTHTYRHPKPHHTHLSIIPSQPTNDRELLIRLSAERRCPAGLGVCAVVKNEAAYIQEWLAFHLHSGVQHFYLYLNSGDEGDMLTALKPFVDVRRRIHMSPLRSAP